MRAAEEPMVAGIVRARTIPAAYFPLAVVAALTLFPALLVAVGGSNYYLFIVMFTLMYVALASSWNIIGGFAGYISLGHNVFFGLGAYFTGLLFSSYGLSPFLTAPLAGGVAILLGLVVGLITLRTRGPAFIIATIALTFVVRLAFENWELAGGTNGLALPPPPYDPRFVLIPFYYGMLVAAVGAVYLAYRIRHSTFGLGLQAIADDEVRAEVAGVPTSLYKILAFGASAFFVGMAGALWGYQLTYLKPSAFFAVLTSANMVLMAVVGGRGTIAGPVLGAFVMVIAQEIFVTYFGATELNVAGTGLFLLIVLLFFPEGIVGTLRRVGRCPWWLNW